MYCREGVIDSLITRTIAVLHRILQLYAVITIVYQLMDLRVSYLIIKNDRNPALFIHMIAGIIALLFEQTLDIPDLDVDHLHFL